MKPSQFCSALPLLVVAAGTASLSTNAFTATAPFPSVLASSKSMTARTHQALAMSLRPTYDAMCGKITEALGLQETDFADSFGAKEWKCESTGMTGSAAWMSEVDPRLLTGVSMCTRVDADGTSNEKMTINIWMGPSYDVPNMLLTFGEETDGTYMVEADYVPRGATPIGSDPQYMEAFYGTDVMDAWTAAHALGGVSTLQPHPSDAMRLLYSPARIALGNISSKEAAEGIVQATVDRFLAWLEGASPVAARLRGSFNLRDDKLRQYFYRGCVDEFVPMLGDSLGLVVAAVNTGPTAEAYVGGGS